MMICEEERRKGGREEGMAGIGEKRKGKHPLQRHNATHEGQTWSGGCAGGAAENEPLVLRI